LDEWQPGLAIKPTEHGTMGLAAQLGSLGVDHQLDVGVPFGDLDDDEPEDARWPAKADEVPSASEDPWSVLVRQRIMAHTLSQLADRSMPEVERVALAWIAYHLTMSDHADVAFLLPRFFARDIGVSEDQAQAVLASLVEKRVIHRETRLDDERRMAIRLVVDGMNDPRHEPSAN
jgi:DNA-binding MarR family transcriptional regulator